MFTHIFTPTDGSPLSREAVTRALQLAKSVGAAVTFFYARPDYPISFYGEGALIDPTTPEQFAQATRAQAEGILEAAAAEGRQAGVTCHTESVVSDTPWQAIIEGATKARADLVFMASHGRRGLAGLLLGSETQKVLTHSKIPVLVYR
jgi:nucleotide-binding universal stress UspA family protein